MENNKYADGLFYNEPRQGAPEFILGSISISKARFLTWLDNQSEDEKGYVKLDIKRSQKGTSYFELNTWKPTKQW